MQKPTGRFASQPADFFGNTDRNLTFKGMFSVLSSVSAKPPVSETIKTLPPHKLSEV